MTLDSTVSLCGALYSDNHSGDGRCYTMSTCSPIDEKAGLVRWIKVFLKLRLSDKRNTQQNKPTLCLVD